MAPVAMMHTFREKVSVILRDRHFVNANMVMLSALFVANIFAFLYQIFVARSLSPLAFGVFNVLLSILVILTMPLAAVQTFAAKVTAHLRGLDQSMQCRHFFYRMIRRIGLAAVILTAIAIIFAPQIATFLKLPSANIVTLLVVILFFYFLLPVNLGILQGMEEFRYLGFVHIFHNVARFVAGSFLLYFYLKSDYAALSAYGLAVFSAFCISFLILQKIFARFEEREIPSLCSEDTHYAGFWRYFLPTTLGLFSFMTLTNIDMVLVKHFFSPYDAGIYAFCHLIGRIILFATASVCIVMFPMVKRLHAQNREAMAVFKKSLLVGAGLSFTGAAIIMFFPQLFVKLITGKLYQESLVLVRLFSVVMATYSLSNIFLYYAIAIEDFRPVCGFVLAAVLLLVFIVFFHQSLLQVLYISLSVGSVLLVGNCLFVFLPQKKT